MGGLVAYPGPWWCPDWAATKTIWGIRELGNSVGFPEFLYMAPFCSGHQDDDFKNINSCITRCSKDWVSTDRREWGWESASFFVSLTSDCYLHAPAPAWWRHPLSLPCLYVLVTTSSLYFRRLKACIVCFTSPRSPQSLLWLFSTLSRYL